jgi:hypothetical protein
MLFIRIAGWILAVIAGAAGTAMVVTGMIEDLIQIVRAREDGLAHRWRSR